MLQEVERTGRMRLRDFYIPRTLRVLPARLLRCDGQVGGSL